MRLQGRLYGICLVLFITLTVPEREKAFISARNHFVNHQNTALNPETKKQATNSHIFRLLGRLYSLILSG